MKTFYLLILLACACNTNKPIKQPYVDNYGNTYRAVYELYYEYDIIGGDTIAVDTIAKQIH